MAKITNVGKLRTLAAVLLVTGLALPVWALTDKPGDDCHHQHGDQGRRADGPFEHMVKALELTDAQREQAKTLHEQFRTKMEGEREQARTLRDNFHQAVKSGASEAELKALADQMAAQMSNHMVQRSLEMQAFNALLTPEQQAKLESLHERRGKFRGHHGGEPEMEPEMEPEE